MFEQTSDFFDIFRSSLLAYLLIVVPICTISPCLASKEFPVFRLQQFELHGQSYGTTGSLLNVETRILPGSPIVTSPRRCYVVKLLDLTVGMYRELLKHEVAGIFVIVPGDLAVVSAELRDQITDVEKSMLEEATSVPVYFVAETPQVEELYHVIKKNSDSLGQTASGLQTLIQHIHGNGVQLVSSLGTPKAMPEAQITTIQGILQGTKQNNNYPILICSHYDSMSPAADLSFGGDSNASGAATLLELARVFSHMYSNRVAGVNGKLYNSLLFALTGAGKFNFQGTQKYLEDQIDSVDHSEVQDTRLAICLDSLAGNKDQLYIHLSRSIKEGTVLHAFIKNMQEISNQLYPEVKVEIVQRKVKTEGLLSWEHEKFHLKKINAVTLSSHKDPSEIRRSLMDTTQAVDTDDLVKKTHIIAESLATCIFNISTGQTFSGSMGVSKTSMDALLEYIGSEPRSAQVLATKQNKFVQSLKSVLGRYTHETSVFYMKPDKRDSNLVFYDGTSGTITAYDVKPAVFDLVVSMAVAAYVFLLYGIIKNFHHVFDGITASKAKETVSSNGVHHNGKAKSQ